MCSLNIVCIVSSLREGRLAERMVKLIKNEFDQKLAPKGHTLSVIEPDEYDLPVLKQPLHFYPDQSQAPAALHKLNDIVTAADAYIILTAEYNRSMPPGLTNLLDHLPPPNFEFKPSGLCSYSVAATGGAFACAAARPFLSEIGCIAAQREVKEDGTTENAHIKSSIHKLFGELEWWGVAAKNQRQAVGKPGK